MEIPATILEILKCNSCEAYLSRSPVYLQHDGAAICGRCFTPKRVAGIRNVQYEATAALLIFPCKYRELGCPDKVPFAGETEELAHEEVCEHRQYVCPVLGSARCDWLGTRATMLAHCRDQHPDSVLENPCSLIHDISKASLHNYIVTAFQLLFLLHTKVCVTTGKIYHAIRLLGASVEAANYHYTMEIKRDDELLVKKGQVVPQGCLAIQEDTSLALDTNSLLAVFGGFDDAKFTLTVKRKVSDVLTCGECKAAVTVFRYHDENGWRCEHCTPTKVACENQDQGCTYTDIYNKCMNHSQYFCQLSTYCFICHEDLSRGSLSAHYSSEHQNITNRAGSMWLATRIGNWGPKRLVYSAAGSAMCSYWLTDTEFKLAVCTPVSSERLHEFRCIVQLTNPTTGHTRTYTPDLVYNIWWDWYIKVKKEEFPSWSDKLNISVDINKID